MVCRSPGRWRATSPRACRAFTLFATHYFELTTLATEVEGCANVHLDASEHGEAIVFLHAVKDGPADRSYGLQVAQLAGVPVSVIGRGAALPRATRVRTRAQRAAGVGGRARTAQTEPAAVRAARRGCTAPGAQGHRSG